MLEQIRIDVKHNFFSSTTAIVFVAITVLFLGNFFTAVTQKDTATDVMFGTFTDFTDKVDTQLNILRHTKPLSNTQRLQKQVLTSQDRYLNKVTDAHAGLFAMPQTATMHTVNLAILALRRFELRTAKAGHAQYLIDTQYPGISTRNSLHGRQEAVVLYQYFARHRLNEIPTTKTSAPAPNYLLNYFWAALTPFLLLVVLAVHSAELTTLGKRTTTIQFNNILPRNKTKIWTAHIISYWLLLSAEVLAAMTVTTLIVGAKFGFGNSRYPLVYYAHNAVHLITIRQFLLQLMIQLLLALLFLTVVSALVALFSGALGSNLLILGVIIATGLPQLLALPGIRSVAQFLPATSFNLRAVILHQTGWPQTSYLPSLLLLGGWTIALYLVGCRTVRNRAQL